MSNQRTTCVLTPFRSPGLGWAPNRIGRASLHPASPQQRLRRPEPPQPATNGVVVLPVRVLAARPDLNTHLLPRVSYGSLEITGSGCRAGTALEQSDIACRPDFSTYCLPVRPWLATMSNL